MDYYNSCGREKSDTPINMNLIHFENKAQYIYNKKVNLQQGQAIHKFLRLSKNRPDSQVREMIIDSCNMNDEVLAEFLKGAVDQMYENDKGLLVQHLYNFVYSNNTFGEKSLEQFLKLTKDLIEIRLNNVHLGIKSTIMEELTEHFNDY